MVVLKRNKRLTIKQERFVRELIKTGNASESYRRSYNCENMKPATIKRRAKELVDNDKILARLNEHAERNDVCVDRILQEERRLAYSDLRGLFDKDWSLIAPKDLPEDVARAVSGVEVKKAKDGTITYKYKFWSKSKALERLEKHLGMFERDNAQRATKIQIMTVANIKKPPKRCQPVTEIDEGGKAK